MCERESMFYDSTDAISCLCFQVMRRLLDVGEDRPMSLGHLVAREKSDEGAQVMLIGDLN